MVDYLYNPGPFRDRERLKSTTLTVTLKTPPGKVPCLHNALSTSAFPPTTPGFFEQLTTGGVNPITRIGENTSSSPLNMTGASVSTSKLKCSLELNCAF